MDETFECETWNYKPLKENVGEELYDIGLDHDLLKAEIDKWDCINLKSFYTAGETLNRVKRWCLVWKKILAKHVSDEELISKICKELKTT
jgi:hypothetical protein